MMHSIGQVLTAGALNTIFTVPAGYKALVSMIYISNQDSVNKTIDVGWLHNHGTPHTIRIVTNYNLAANTFIQFDTGSLVIQAGDALTMTPEAGAVMDCVVTFKLYKETPIAFFTPE